MKLFKGKIGGIIFVLMILVIVSGSFLLTYTKDSKKESVSNPRPLLDFTCPRNVYSQVSIFTRDCKRHMNNSKDCYLLALKSFCERTKD